MLNVEFLIPGNINLPTGGYVYDREIAAALPAHEVRASIHQLDEDLWSPTSGEAAAAVIAGFNENTIVLLDGLALAPLSDVIVAHRRRLKFCALLHHPAALETGLARATAAGIAIREAAALREMNCVICTSDWTAGQICAAGTASERVSVVRPGVAATIAVQRTTPLRRRPEIAHAEGPRMLCVATVTPRKGHERLITALAELKDYAWQLDCIGSLTRDRNYATHIDSLIQYHDLAARIHMHGEIDATELADAYARADLFVLASHLEGYGMAFAEARAAGLPIVATSGGAVTETLQHAAAVVVDGQHASLTDTLRTLLSEHADWIGLAGAAQAEMSPPRDWDQAAMEFAAALRGALAQ